MSFSEKFFGFPDFKSEDNTITPHITAKRIIDIAIAKSPKCSYRMKPKRDKLVLSSLGMLVSWLKTKIFQFKFVNSGRNKKYVLIRKKHPMAMPIGK